MVALPNVYNTSDLPDTGGKLPLIPDGDYNAVILASELKATKDGNGQFLAMKIVITQGQYRDTEFTERLNIINPNAQAVQIAYQTLARISEAVGMTQTPGDSALLHNKPLIIRTKTEPGNDYNDKQTGELKKGNPKSVIAKYLPAQRVGVGAGQPTFAQAAPPAPQPAPFSPPAAAAAAAAASGAPVKNW